MNDGPTIPARFRTMPPDCPEPVRLTVSIATARDMEHRAWWRGLRFGIALGGVAILTGMVAGMA